MAVFERIERKSRRWEQVWQGEAEAVASIVAGRLEAEGIQARIHGHTTPYRTAAMNLGGTWGILVPAGKATRAREVLRANEEGHNVIEDESAAGLTSTQKSTVRFVVLLGVAIGALIAVLTVLGSN